MAGIAAWGAYAPRLRLSRKAVTEANAWVAPNLKAKGKGIVYISHRMDELKRICDRVTVMRDGCSSRRRPAPSTRCSPATRTRSPTRSTAGRAA